MSADHIKNLFIVLFLLCIPSTAFANAGVPMLFLVMPAFIISLVPIILIEASYLSTRLAFDNKKITKVTVVSNLVSTMAGIPLTWVLLVVIEIALSGGSAYDIDTITGKILSVTLQAPWLIPYENELKWMIPVAGTILLIPFFFTSWWVEYFVAKRMLVDVDLKLLKNKICNANLITYFLLMLWPLCWWLLN